MARIIVNQQCVTAQLRWFDRFEMLRIEIVVFPGQEELEIIRNEPGKPALVEPFSSDF